MASVNEEEAVTNNKRKITDEEEEQQKPKEKEAKTGDPILDIVVAGEVKTIETWKRVVAGLAEAHIFPCDDYGDNSMKWKGQGGCNVELDVSVGHDTGSLDLYPTYTLYRFSVDGKLVSYKNYRDDSWGDLIVQLKQWIAEMRNEAARAKVTNHLKSELANWTSLLTNIPNDKIPVFPEASLEDCRLVLQWSSTDGNNIIRVDRGPVLNNHQSLGNEVSFRITATSVSDPNFAVRTCTPSVDKAINKIAYLLKKDESNE